MQAITPTPNLAEVADVLSDRFRSHLIRFAEVVEPQSAALDRRFRAALKRLGFNRIQQAALANITPGETARILTAGGAVGEFFEQVAYNARRLAKFNISPGAISAALARYDRLLAPILQQASGEEIADLRWVRDQLHFCVILTLNDAFYQVREAETQAFYELFHGELAARNLEDLLRRFLETLLRFCRADEAHLYLLAAEDGTWTPMASVSGQPRPRPVAAAVRNSAVRRKHLARPQCAASAGVAKVALDVAWHRDFASCWSMPLTSEGRLAGVMQFAFRRPYEWLPRERELLAGAAERCVLAAEKARLIEDLATREEQIRQLGEHMLHIEEVERKRISRELHDEAGQSLMCIRLQLEVLEQGCRDRYPDMRCKLSEVREMTERTIIEIRRLIRALSPSVLDQFGLGAALRQLITQFRHVHQVGVRLQMAKLEPLPKQTEIMVYRLVQECINNIAKHSAATTVNISLSSADEELRLEVDDNGVGFRIDDALAKQNSFGLAGMRERVALLGGKFGLESCPAGRVGKGKSGTKIRIRIPIPSLEDEDIGTERYQLRRR